MIYKYTSTYSSNASKARRHYEYTGHGWLEQEGEKASRAASSYRYIFRYEVILVA